MRAATGMLSLAWAMLATGLLTQTAGGESAPDERAAASRKPLIVAAAGDISDCAPPQCRAAETAARIRRIDPHLVLALGDLQYPSGTLTSFRRQYDRTWGTFKARTRPVPGNHEYLTPGASGYFRYFGGRAHPRRGYYSFNDRSWHFVALNTNDECRTVRCGPTSEQVDWLRRDLRTAGSRCILAYWHEPRWSTGKHGGNPVVQTLWRTLAAHGADVVLNGHDHTYERYAPRDASGSFRAKGTTQFVVGTGGAALGRFDRPAAPLTRKRIGKTHGVLRLSLSAHSWGWRYVTASGAVRDAGGPVGCR